MSFGASRRTPLGLAVELLGDCLRVLEASYRAVSGHAVR